MSGDMIGIVGVGLMGHGIATNIQKSGRSIGFLDHPGNQPTDALVAAGAWRAATARELAGRCGVIVLCVTGSPQVEAVLTGEAGILEGLKPGKVIIDCSTAIPEATRRMAALVAAAGGRMLDAPMTRTPKEAAEGRLNLIVGGDKALFDEQLPLLRSFAENVTHVGGIGSGHVMKLLHNYVSLGFSALLAEAAAAANRAGIDPHVLHDVLAKGGGAGVVLDRMTPFILSQDCGSFRFSISNALKDLDYYSTMAADQHSPAGIANAVRDTYGAAVKAGDGELFVPELIRLLDREA